MAVRIDGDGLLVTQPNRGFGEGLSSFLLSRNLNKIGILEKGRVDAFNFTVIGNNPPVSYSVATINFSQSYPKVKRFELLVQRTSATSNPRLSVGTFYYPPLRAGCYYEVFQNRAEVRFLPGNPFNANNYHNLYWILFDEDIIP